MANKNYSVRSNKKRTVSYVLFGISAILILLLCISATRRFVYGVFGYAVYAYLPMLLASAILLLAGRTPEVKPLRAVLYITLFMMAVTTLHIGLSKDLLETDKYLTATYSAKTVGGVFIGLIASLFKLICVDRYAWMLAVSFVVTALLGLVAIYPVIAIVTDRSARKPKKQVKSATRQIPQEEAKPFAVDEPERNTLKGDDILNLSGTRDTRVEALMDEPIIPQYRGRGANILFGNEPLNEHTRGGERKSGGSGYHALDKLGQDDFNRAITNQERMRLLQESLGRKSDAEEYAERFGNGKLDGEYAQTREFSGGNDHQYVVKTERVIPNATGLYESNDRFAPAEPEMEVVHNAQTSRQSEVRANDYGIAKKEERTVTEMPKDRASMLDYIRRPMSTDEYDKMDLFREVPSERATAQRSTEVVTEVVEPKAEVTSTVYPTYEAREAETLPTYRDEPTYPVREERLYKEAPVVTAPTTSTPRTEVRPQKPTFTSEAMRKQDEPELARQARMARRAQNVEVGAEDTAPVKKPYVPKPYKAPPYELLRDYGEGSGNVPTNYEEIKAKIEETMMEFDIPATVEKAERGPTFSMYYLKLGPGYKINKIMSIKENLKMRLRVKSLRILAPIEGYDNFGIEIPNEIRDTVGLRSIICSKTFNEKSGGIQIAVGKTLDGGAYVADLAKMPHLLVAGATGTGKSVFLNSLITSILFKYSPEDVRLILIDPKRVELSVYRGLPNLLIKETIKETKHAVNVLQWLTQEMDRRYSFFEKVGCANIDQYNTLYRQKDEPKMYRIVLIVDEMADLMMKAKDNTVEECIVRIAQLARACGIHMVIATQRPIVKVITGLIKGNILHRVAFTVKSNQDSRVILDDGGAEELLGNGDMLYSFPANLVRIQGAFIDMSELKAVTDYIKENNEGDFDEELVKIVTYEPPKPETAEEKSQAREEERDADFERLLRKILKSFILEQRASVSSAQASHHVGYIKARKLIDAMTERGFLSKGDGAKPRDILITLDQYYEIFGKEDDINTTIPEDDDTYDE